MVPCDVRAARTMSSTRAAWYPRPAKTPRPASSSRRSVRRPCARSSRPCAGRPGWAPSRDGDDLYVASASAGGGPDGRAAVTGTDPAREPMLAATLREAARRFADVPAVVTEQGWALTYRELDRVSDEVAVGLARRGLRSGDVLAL